jgi:hypothetical protein
MYLKSMKNSNIKHKPYGCGIARKAGERIIAIEISGGL